MKWERAILVAIFIIGSSFSVMKNTETKKQTSEILIKEVSAPAIH
ncbi:hypothetical protein ACJVC5_13985 [Peredibacter sp. HCB2-198]